MPGTEGGLFDTIHNVDGFLHLPQQLDEKQRETECGTNPEVEGRVHHEEESCNESDEGVAERTPHAGLAVLEVVQAAHAFCNGFHEARACHKPGGEDDRTDDGTEPEVGLKEGAVNKVGERADASGDHSEEDCQVALSS